MPKFRVKYATGKLTEVESSDCATVEAFCNTHFGTTWAAAQKNGAEVEMLGCAEPTEAVEGDEEDGAGGEYVDQGGEQQEIAPGEVGSLSSVLGMDRDQGTNDEAPAAPPSAA